MATNFEREETRTRADIDAEYAALVLNQAHAESLSQEDSEAVISRIANQPSTGLLTKSAGGDDHGRV
jgi:hypothetical protein